MSRKLIPFVLFLLALPVFWGCDSIVGKHKEGLITYDVTYPAETNNSSMVALMPGTMTLRFKKHHTLGELSGSMGIFTTQVISDSKKKQIYQTLKVLGKKFAALYDEKIIAQELAKEPKQKITFSEETKMIAGFKCKKATVTFEDPKLIPFDVYYTEEIKIKNPNWFSPYKEIPGVLMEYRVKRYNVEMHLLASKVEEIDVETDDFEIGPDFKIIPKEELEEMFTSFN